MGLDLVSGLGGRERNGFELMIGLGKEMGLDLGPGVRFPGVATW